MYSKQSRTGLVRIRMEGKFGALPGITLTRVLPDGSEEELESLPAATEPDELLASLSRERGEGNRDFVIDLDGVGWINSTGLGILIHLQTRLKELDGSAVLIHVSPRVRNVLHMTGVDKVFVLLDSLEDARRHFRETGEPGEPPLPGEA